MKVVLDASAALAAVLGQRSQDAILEVLSRATVVMAPELFVAEVTSGLWKYVGAKQLTIEEAGGHLSNVLALVDRLEPIAPLAQEILREASARRHPVYDLCYVVLARREGATLLTVDARLKKLAVAAGIVAVPSS